MYRKSVSIMRNALFLLASTIAAGQVHSAEQSCNVGYESDCGTPSNYCTKIVFVPVPWGHKHRWCCLPEEPPRGRIAESVPTFFTPAKAVGNTIVVPRTTVPPENKTEAGNDTTPPAAEANCKITTNRLDKIEQDINATNENVKELHGSVKALVEQLSKLGTASK